MKRAALLLSVLVAQAAAAEQRHARAASLQLFFETSEPFDGQCSGFKHHEDYKITASMRAELDKRLPEFEQLWRNSGDALIAAMGDLLRRPYKRTQETITLTLCQWISPLSSPLIMRVREYLRATAVDNPHGPTELKPDAYFVGQVHHELIHRYLDQYFPDIAEPKRSAMVRSHASEPEGVRVHLHLLALQKAVYLKLDRHKELEMIREQDKRIGEPYKRAWEIVEQDGYEKYIRELSRQP
jgi:hypothetical protein